MNRRFALISGLVICSCLCSQDLVNDPRLKEYRKGLEGIDSLMQNGILLDDISGLEYFTGYDYKTLNDWDQYFEAILQIYMGWPSDYIKNGVIIFLQNQRNNGFIARSVPGNEWHDQEHVKPFLAQNALLVYLAYGELDWITTDEYFPRLQKYLDFWLNDMDENKNGLSEWMSAPHTGMDNQHERAGFWLDRNCEGIDLNSYLVRETQAFARLAELAGKQKLAKQYRMLSDQRKARIRELLWDPEEGFYYDRKKDKDQPIAKSLWVGAQLNVQSAGKWKIPVRSIAAFTAMWAGVATESQANAMVTRYLTNPREFWSPYPVSALSKSEIGYSTTALPGDIGCSWRANTWIPANYMIYHGLKWYGYNGIASSLARRTVELIEKAGNREYYNSETGEGVGLDPFWGWSLLGHFFMLEEALDWDINEINADAYDQP
jgi:hypothetical protein